MIWLIFRGEHGRLDVGHAARGRPPAHGLQHKQTHQSNNNTNTHIKQQLMAFGMAKLPPREFRSSSLKPWNWNTGFLDNILPEPWAQEHLNPDLKRLEGKTARQTPRWRGRGTGGQRARTGLRRAHTIITMKYCDDYDYYYYDYYCYYYYYYYYY